MSAGTPVLTAIEWLARIAGVLATRAPLLLLIAFFVSPVGPHMRFSGQYYGTQDNPRFVSCTYLGSRGLQEVRTPTCPIFLWLDTRRNDQ